MNGRMTILIAAAALLGACDSSGDETPMCPGDPEFVSVDIPTEAVAGSTIHVAYEVKNFEFTLEDPEEGHEGHGDQLGDNEQFRALEHPTGDSGCIIGHVHLYVDDLMTNPIAMITHPEADIMLPADLAEGEHTFMSRLQDGNHLIIKPEIIEETKVTITAP